MMTLTSLSFLNNAWVEDFYQKFIEDDFSCDLTCTVIVMGEAVSILHMMVKVVSDALEWGIKCLLVTIIENVRFVFTQIYHLHSEVWCMKYKLSTSNDSNALLYRSRSLISLVYLVLSNSLRLTAALWNISNKTSEIKPQGFFLISRSVNYFHNLHLDNVSVLAVRF